MKSLYQECLNLGIAVDSEDAVYVFAESLLYSIGSTGAFAFQDHIRSHCKTKSPKVFRLHLREQVYSNLTIKLYLLHVVLAKPTTSHYRKLAARYNISKRDAWLIVKLLSENEWFRREVKRFVRSTPYTLLDLEQRSIDAMFTRVFPTVLKYIKHITYTKLRFLVRSTNSDFSDFHSDLSAKLVQSFYSVIPTKMSDAHLINYLRRSVHNHAINMIKMGTTQKRGRLISTEADSKGKRQFAMLCLSQNQLDLTSIGETQDVDGEDESPNKFEIRFAISEVLDSMKLHSRKYRFLTLLLGSEDVEFSKYLRTQGICRDEEDNVDVQNRVAPGEYTKLVSNFLRVPKSNVGVFFESLRHQLAW
jgi:hypothetical protein